MTKLIEHKDEVTDETECKLLYINDDEIPELWMHNGYMKCSYVFTALNGECDEVETHGYIEGEEYKNKFLDSYGRMGYRDDYLYKIENGKFITVTEGEVNEYYEDSNYILEYIIFGRGEVTYEEYNKEFEIDDTFNILSISYDQCIELFRDYQDGKKPINIDQDFHDVKDENNYNEG